MAAAIAELTAAKGGRVLTLAPRLEILDQLVRECTAASIPVRSIQAENDVGPRDAPVTVASIWTLATPRWRAQLPFADLIIVDECHRAMAERSYREILNAYPGARILGLTATPARSDGRALGEAFDEIVVATTTAELTERGFLVPCDIKVPNGDGQLLALPVLDAYRKFAADRLAIVFAASVSHAHAIGGDFVAAGIPVAVVTGKTPDAERGETMQRFAAGSIRVLVNVACFIEGLDVPACSAAIFARKFGHVGSYLQAIGRVLRPAPGKRDAVVADLLGSALQPGFGPPTMEREYSLDGQGIRSLAPRDAIRQCQHCGSVFIVGPPACPYCGTGIPLREAKPLRSDGRGLVDLPSAPAEPKREYVVTMVSKRMGTCARCGRGIRSGERIFWATLARVARHETCPAAPAAEVQA
jgi:DNA repair protein RadD